MINRITKNAHIWELHQAKHTLRVIAERVCNFYMDEWKALNLVIVVLYAKGMRWTNSQMRTAVKYCFDPRYYTRHDIKELYEKAGFKLDYLPHVPIWWRGITEWINEGKKLRRLSSDDLKAGKDELGEDSAKTSNCKQTDTLQIPL